jgi:chorismate dehydratase
VRREVPARVADALHRGELDLGTIPSIEYAAGDYAIVPGVAITSRGRVRSVNLFLKRPLGEVQRVAVDTSSRTSAALVRILLRARLSHEPEYVPMRPDVVGMLGVADAALVIGDPALYFEGATDRVDLGEAWTALTGLPFVWALWAGRKGALRPDQASRLQRAQREAQESFAEIAASYSPGDARRAALNEDYLRRNIVYALGEPEVAGLREFLKRAHGLGLIARAPEIEFYANS